MAKRFSLTADSDGYTVGELLSILQDADPDALIIIGSDPDNCNEYLYQIHVGNHTVGFFTEPSDNK